MWLPKSYTAHILNGCQEALNCPALVHMEACMTQFLTVFFPVSEMSYPHLSMHLAICWYLYMESIWLSPCNNSYQHQHFAGKTWHCPHRRHVNILELTIPTNTRESLHWQAARRGNQKSHYASNLSVIWKIEAPSSVSFKTLENGSLGHYAPCAIKYLTSTFGLSKQLAKSTLPKLSQISVVWSYHIFNQRNCKSWASNIL